MIKVGDWVKHKSTMEIARVRVVDNDKYINGVCIDDCIKLPIKFKPFEINSNVCELRRIKGNENNILFFAYETNYEVYASYQEYADDSKVHSSYFPTIEQAKDWLELQYATMLVKARGLA